MNKYVNGRQWDSCRVIIRDVDFEIHATINAVPESQEVIYELQNAILTVFRIHGAKAATRRADRNQDRQLFKRKPLDGMSDFLS